jgi:hypothetical protein
MKLDKTQVARRHLGTALALFLDDRDPVPVHTLACAGLRGRRAIFCVNWPCGTGADCESVHSGNRCSSRPRYKTFASTSVAAVLTWLVRIQWG